MLPVGIPTPQSYTINQFFLETSGLPVQKSCKGRVDFHCAWVFVIAVTVGNAMPRAKTSEQCRWTEFNSGSRWQTAFSPVVVKAGSDGVQPLVSLRQVGPVGGRRRGGGGGAALKLELEGERKL